MCGFVGNVSISLSFQAPTLWATDLNSKSDKTCRVTPMIESLWTTQIAFFRFAAPSWGVGGDEVQKVFVQESVQGKIVWNHLWEHRFSVRDPRVFPPPGDRFSAQTTENRIYNWAALKGGSPVKSILFNLVPRDFSFSNGGGILENEKTLERGFHSLSLV